MARTNNTGRKVEGYVATTDHKREARACHMCGEDGHLPKQDDVQDSNRRSGFHSIDLGLTQMQIAKIGLPI